jgi:hypothetical protein
MQGYFLLFTVTFFYSCKTKQVSSPEIKIAKTVPFNFFNAADQRIISRNDTVFYDGHLYSGYLYTLYPGGDTSFVGSWFNGVEEGYHRKWYEDHSLAEERFFINGKKEGEHKGWWPSGKPKFQFTAYDDEYTGVFREWYASGVLGKEFHYTAGHEEGSQRLWWENGIVRANYVIRNGKKYGLIGLKTCVNPYDSINKK